MAACALVVTVAAALLMDPGRPALPPVFAALSAAGMAVLGSGSSSDVGWFGVCVLVGWCAFTASTRATAALWAAFVMMFGLEWLLTTDDLGWACWIAGTTFAAFACLLARRQRDLTERLRNAQAGLADRVRAEERNRIARELHDVIAHSLTVSLLHVSSARLAVEEDPAEAVRALAEAERLGRDCLTEVRQPARRTAAGGTGQSFRCSQQRARRRTRDPCPAGRRPGTDPHRPARHPAGPVRLRDRRRVCRRARRRGGGSEAQPRMSSEGTIKTHVSHIFAKLQLPDRAAAIVFAFDHGLVAPSPRRQL